MNLLLDTHAFLWFIAADTSLSQTARQAIEDPANTCWLSVASLWEMTIKVGLGRLTVPLPIQRLVREHVLGNGIQALHLQPEHLDQLRLLPTHHKDPFDRLLIAQSITENMTLLSKDRHFSSYPIAVLW